MQPVSKLAQLGLCFNGVMDQSEEKKERMNAILSGKNVETKWTLPTPDTSLIVISIANHVDCHHKFQRCS